jgi:hypothetical protein
MNHPFVKIVFTCMIGTVIAMSTGGCWKFFGSDSVSVKAGKGLDEKLIQLKLYQGAGTQYKHLYIVKQGERTSVPMAPSTVNQWEVMYGEHHSRGFSLSKTDGREDYRYQFEYYLDRFGQVCVRVLVNGKKMEDFALYVR